MSTVICDPVNRESRERGDSRMEPVYRVQKDRQVILDVGPGVCCQACINLLRKPDQKTVKGKLCRKIPASSRKTLEGNESDERTRKLHSTAWMRVICWIIYIKEY